MFEAGVAFPVAALLALASSFVMVSRLERVAGRLRLSEAMLGLAVALAADSPEITSSVTASAHGQSVIGIGVVLGSNVFNLAALLGLATVVAGRIGLHRKVVIFEGVTAFWIAITTLAVIAAGWSAGAGAALVLVAVAFYVLVLTSSSGALVRIGFSQRVAQWLSTAAGEEELELAVAIRAEPAGRFDAALLAASLAMVVAASAVMERSAEVLGRHLHVSRFVIGSVVLAAVTSLPNAVGAVFLASRGRGAAVLSEAMNSNMLNVIVGLFLPGIFLGLGQTGGDGTLVAGWYVGLTLLTLLIAFAGRGLDRKSGWVIVIAYGAFVVVGFTA
ncbi:MAG TPA: hypothetical protein VMO88_17470 [Acidimicrobiales bacterium]|nr:hypothetical protein [Acidimicrobiales bacterium]